ncbi:MAG: hypothetical protein PHV59_02450 [Victivallales bacterium]|nr:hypothetical protein [Victivallales bacterium]
MFFLKHINKVFDAVIAKGNVVFKSSSMSAERVWGERPPKNTGKFDRIEKDSVKSFMKNGGCNASVIQRPKALVARLQRAKVYAACRIEKYLTRKAIFSKKNEVNFFENVERSS